MDVFVLTGAGVSAESSLPTFRDPDGLWERYSPMQIWLWARAIQSPPDAVVVSAPHSLTAPVSDDT